MIALVLCCVFVGLFGATERRRNPTTAKQSLHRIVDSSKNVLLSVDVCA